MEQFTEQWNNLPFPLKFLIVVLLWMAMAGAYYLTTYDDQVNQYKRLIVEFKDARKKRDELQTIQFNIERWKTEIARLDGELEKAKLLLPTQKYLPKLLRRIDDLGRKSGLEIAQFNPTRLIKRGFYSEVPIQVEVKGTFFETMIFLNKVSNLQRIVTIDNVDISQPLFKNQKMMLNARFKLITYRYHSPDEKKKKKKKKG